MQSCLLDLVFESRTPADPVDHPCTTLGHLRGPSLLCRTLQWSRRITPIQLDSPASDSDHILRRILVLAGD